MAYCLRSDVEQHFGVENVKKWADLDDDENTTTIASRVAYMIEVADSYIDAHLRAAHFEPLPIEQDDSSSAPTIIKHLSAELTGVLLYEARGVQHFHPESGRPQHVLSWHRSYVKLMLRQIQAQSIVLDAKK
jgi:hypothetical protein